MSERASVGRPAPAGRFGGRDHGHDLELHEIAPARGPLVEQRGVIGLHELEAAVEMLGIDPAVEVEQPVGEHPALAGHALVDGSRTLAVPLDHEVLHAVTSLAGGAFGAGWRSGMWST